MKATGTQGTREEKRVVVRSAIVQHASTANVPEPSEISLSAARYQRVAGHWRSIEKLVGDYADAVGRARAEGLVQTLTFSVQPNGEFVTRPSRPEVDLGSGADPFDVALARAKERGDAKIAAIMAGPDMLSARDFGRLIGASHETVNVKRRKFEILGMEGATRGIRYPRWQVTDEGHLLPGLATIAAILGGETWTVYRFLRTTHAELGGRTALDTLKAGQLDAAALVARNQSAGAFT